MTQLYVPRFASLPPAPAWLRPVERESGEVLIVVLGDRQSHSADRFTRLSSDSAQAYRIRRRQPRFSWRSAWLGALSALGLVGGLAAGAEATQPDRPIRIALPPARPTAASATPAPAMLVVPVMVPNSSPGRSNTGLRARGGSTLPSDDPISSSTKLAGTTPRVSSRPSDGGPGEFYRAEPVQAAAQRAILSGIAQSWTYGGLTGVVIAGPLDLHSNTACHRIALWAENRPESGGSMAFTSCLNDRGEWKTPAGLRPAPSSGSIDLP